MVKGKVSKLASFGAFVEIEEGIDCLVHISQISEERVQKVRDALQPGQEVEARVIKIDPVQRRIGLRHQGCQDVRRRIQVDESMLEGLRPGEDLVDLAGAFDEAFGSGSGDTEERHPGQKVILRPELTTPRPLPGRFCFNHPRLMCPNLRVEKMMIFSKGHIQ